MPDTTVPDDDASLLPLTAETIREFADRCIDNAPEDDGGYAVRTGYLLLAVAAWLESVHPDAGLGESHHAWNVATAFFQDPAFDAEAILSAGQSKDFDA